MIFQSILDTSVAGGEAGITSPSPLIKRVALICALPLIRGGLGWGKDLRNNLGVRI